MLPAAERGAPVDEPEASGREAGLSEAWELKQDACEPMRLRELDADTDKKTKKMQWAGAQTSKCTHNVSNSSRHDFWEI